MVDLTMSLDSKLSKPIYEQIYEYMKQEIQNGGLPFRERLPSTRMLSKHLQVSRSTVDMAYEQLMSEGYIESVPCKGYYVSDLDGIYHLAPQTAAKPSEPAEAKEEYRYDFSPYGVDLNSFPHNAWKKISKNILNDDRNDLFMLGNPQGEEELRATIATYLHQARGVSCTAEQIIVGAGTDYLLMLLCSIWNGPHRIAMENPTYKKAYRVLSAMKNEMTVIDMEENGIDVAELQKSMADIVYVMPSHHYPLGIVMPVKQRMKLLKWAQEKEERYIIEDDYDSEFRYKGKPIPSLQGYDHAGKVIYIGTFSKSVAPAIRVSYMVLPESLMKAYRERGKIFSSTVSRVDQTIIARFINEGYYERHLNKVRAVYKSRHDVLLEELRDFEGISVSGENAGVHLLVSFHNGLSEKEAVKRAEKARIKVYALLDYYVEPSKKENAPTVILGYANLREEEIREAAEVLKEIWK